MTWEPVTRGVTPSDQICHFGPCVEQNKVMTYYTVDYHGIRFFCELHWKWIALFINHIKTKCTKCVRNHSADLYKDSRTMSNIKHNDKWWDLCTRHFEYYDKKMCNFLEGLNNED